jgi:hypothetical protein
MRPPQNTQDKHTSWLAHGTKAPNQPALPSLLSRPLLFLGWQIKYYLLLKERVQPDGPTRRIMYRTGNESRKPESERWSKAPPPDLKNAPVHKAGLLAGKRRLDGGGRRA